LRLKFLAAVWFTVCAAVLCAAQAAPPSPHPGPAAPAKPRGSIKAPRTPEAPALPSVFDASSLGSPVILDRDWRVGITSNPAAASPSFDDSAWAVRDALPSIGEVPEEDINAPATGTKASGGATASSAPSAPARRYVWFRLHLQLAQHHGPLALLIELPVPHGVALGLGSPGLSPDVFINGKQIKPEGPHGDQPASYQPISRLYTLGLDSSQTSVTLAIRVIYSAFGRDAYTGFFSNHTIYLGNAADLKNELNLWSNQSQFERLPYLVYSILLAVLAIFLFALYFAQKGHTEYLWLALHELAQAPIGFIEQAGTTARLDVFWCDALVLQLVIISAYLFFEFLVPFLSLPRRWYIRALRYTAPVLACVGPSFLLVFHRGTVLILAAIIFYTFVWMIGWSIFVFGNLIAAAVRRNIEAGLFLVPLGINLIGAIDIALMSALSGEGGASVRTPLTFQAGPIPIHLSNIGDYASILVIVLIVFFRFLRVQRDQERATNELAAARSIQELLIPQEKLATPGFEVDSVYSPATEVGGDFFHVQTVGREGILVVIGDVAGHGLKAAMNVSLLMGALRRTEGRNPARILEALNGVLSGTESFTTAQAIWFGVNGEMVIANAGHLPPYLNSQEINLPGSLPLGVLAEVLYEEARFYLHPGDRMLLLSDGVVEARHSSGELFGFDRVRQLSQQSADYLAEAAKSFGQQDDITVLTVRRQVQVAVA
jgi:hypothetical protein